MEQHRELFVASGGEAPGDAEPGLQPVEREVVPLGRRKTNPCWSSAGRRGVGGPHRGLADLLAQTQLENVFRGSGDEDNAVAGILAISRCLDIACFIEKRV